MATDTTPISIGPYRNIRLKAAPNRLGYFEVWWSERNPHTGIYDTKRKSTGAQDWPGAQAGFAAIVSILRSSVAPQTVVPTIEVLIRRWLDHAHEQGKHRGVGYVLGPVQRELGAYTAGQVAANGASLLEDYLGRRRVSSSTKRREVAQFLAVLRWSAKKGFIDPGNVPLLDLPAGGQARTRFLTEAQFRWFWDQAIAWPDHPSNSRPSWREGAERVRLFAAIAMHTAARREAILELTWDRVDLSRRVIDFNVPGRRTTTKRRVDGMPIHDDLWPILAAAYPGGTGRVIGRVQNRLFARQFARFTGTIGMDWVTPHVLRHTWASLNAMAGLPLFDIAQVLGDTIQMVEKHYAHLAPDHLKRAIHHRGGAARPILKVA